MGAENSNPQRLHQIFIPLDKCCILKIKDQQSAKCNKHIRYSKTANSPR